jgi:hypothetical protein
MGAETGLVLGAIIAGGILMVVSLVAVTVRAVRLTEQVARMEREAREQWRVWRTAWLDRCAHVDRRFERLELQLGNRARGGPKDDN